MVEDVKSRKSNIFRNLLFSGIFFQFRPGTDKVLAH